MAPHPAPFDFVPRETDELIRSLPQINILNGALAAALQPRAPADRPRISFAGPSVQITIEFNQHSRSLMSFSALAPVDFARLATETGAPAGSLAVFQARLSSVMPRNG